MKYKLDSEISVASQSLKDANKKMEDALDLVMEVKALIEDGEWTGESKEVTASLVELCVEFHQKLLSVVDNNQINVNELNVQADDFMRNEPVATLWK